MNVREMIDTVEAKCDLLASQDEREGRQAALREIEGHIDVLRATLGLPHDVPCCCGCGGDPLQRCPDCGGMFGDCCGTYHDGKFLCDVCLEEHEEDEADTDLVPEPMRTPY